MAANTFTFSVKDYPKALLDALNTLFFTRGSDEDITHVFLMNQLDTPLESIWAKFHTIKKKEQSDRLMNVIQSMPLSQKAEQEHTTRIGKISTQIALEKRRLASIEQKRLKDLELNDEIQKVKTDLKIEQDNILQNIKDRKALANSKALETILVILDKVNSEQVKKILAKVNINSDEEILAKVNSDELEGTLKLLAEVDSKQEEDIFTKVSSKQVKDILCKITPILLKQILAILSILPKLERKEVETILIEVGASVKVDDIFEYAKHVEETVEDTKVCNFCKHFMRSSRREFYQSAMKFSLDEVYEHFMRSSLDKFYTHVMMRYSKNSLLTLSDQMDTDKLFMHIINNVLLANPKKYENLESLECYEWGLTDTSIPVIIKVIEKFKKLNHLNLFLNKFTKNIIVELEKIDKVELEKIDESETERKIEVNLRSNTQEIDKNFIIRASKLQLFKCIIAPPRCINPENDTVLNTQRPGVNSVFSTFGINRSGPNFVAVMGRTSKRTKEEEGLKKRGTQEQQAENVNTARPPKRLRLQQ